MDGTKRVERVQRKGEKEGYTGIKRNNNNKSPGSDNQCQIKPKCRWVITIIKQYKRLEEEDGRGGRGERRKAKESTDGNGEDSGTKGGRAL